MRFVPLTPALLATELAGWVNALGLAHPRIGIDGPAEIGAGGLADAIARELPALGRSAIRAETRWWWRPASLRLELGRTDVDMLLRGWLDSGAIRRELLDPLGPGGSGRYLSRLRDPDTDRSVKQDRITVGELAALVLDGPFLQAEELPLDAVIHLQVSRATLERALPNDRKWWLAAYDRYEIEDRPVENATVVVSYDHPSAPAVSWPGDRSHGSQQR